MVSEYVSNYLPCQRNDSLWSEKFESYSLRKENSNQQNNSFRSMIYKSYGYRKILMYKLQSGKLNKNNTKWCEKFRSQGYGIFLMYKWFS